MIQKIMVAYDGSAQAEKAFDLAVEMAAKFEAQLVVLAVARPPEPPEAVETMAILESATEYYKQHFESLRQKGASQRVCARFEVRVGHPAEQIIHFANEDGADMIVMGHRGKTFVQRWLLGSVSKRVLSYAHCSVVIVR